MSHNEPQHPAVARLSAFLLGRLDAAASAEIEAHVLDCPSCCASLSNLGSQTDPFVSRLLSLQQRSRDARESETVDGSPAEETRRLAFALAGVPTLPGYEILGLLGRGGMGVVYKARQRGVNRLVALKVILSGAHAGPQERVRFQAEAEAAARVQHPNIVQIYEIGSHAGLPYLALEFVDGGDLRRAIGGTRHPPVEAARLIETLARAIHAAHDKGVVHRDLKPANILLRRKADNTAHGTHASHASHASHQSLVRLADSEPMIADFGLAKWLNDDRHLTRTGEVAGTPSYMAPEQALGTGGQVGPPTDVYALGAILYELLTGRPPFQASTPLETLSQVCTQEAVPPRRLVPHTPRDLEIICLRCLQKEPARRYASAGVLADDLHRFRHGEPIQARPVGRLERAWKWARRRPAVAALLLAIVLMAILGFAGVSGALVYALAGWEEADKQTQQVNRERDEAGKARDEARAARTASEQQSAELLFDRGLGLARSGKTAEALHWMLASLETSPDPAFQRQVRTHLAGWGARVPTLVQWLDTPHRRGSFAPDSRLFVTAGRTLTNSADKRVMLQFWDLQGGQPLGSPVQTEDIGIEAVVFSPDGRTLLGASSTAQEYQHRPGWASRWSVAERKLLGKSRGHANVVHLAAWAPDGKTFVTGSWDRTLRFWDAATGQAVGAPVPVPGLPSFDTRMVWSADGRWILADTASGPQLCDVPARKTVGPPISVQGYQVRRAAFAADGRALVLVGVDPDKKVHLLWQPWDPATGALRGSPTVANSRHGLGSIMPDGRVSERDGVSPDGLLFREGHEGLRIWRLPRDASLPDNVASLGGPNKLTVAGRIAPACFTADGKKVWTVSPGERAQCWDLAEGWPVGTAVNLAPWPASVSYAATRDGRLIVGRVPGSPPGQNSPVQIWDAATGQPHGSPLEQKNRVNQVAFSPDGKVLASGGMYHAVSLVDVENIQVQATIPVGGIVSDLAFSPNSKTLAVATVEWEVRLVDAAARKLLRTSLKHEGPVERLAFSPDGKRLLALCNRSGHLWDMATCRQTGILRLDDPRQVGLFSPDGEVVLTGTSRSAFRLWSAATGQPLGPPTPAGAKQLSTYAFSPDSKLVVAGAEEGSAQVWEVATSRPLGAPVLQPMPVVGVAFRPGGRSFLTVAADGTLRDWPVPEPLPGHIETIALAVRLSTGLRLDEGRAVVALTRPEWQALRQRWSEQQGARDWSIVPPISEQQWHEARARDAEQEGNAFTARWHLERLRKLRPEDWMLLARLGRTATAAEQWQQAATDYALAEQLGSREQMREWYRDRALVCAVGNQGAAQRWYLDRLLAAQKDR